MKKMKKKMLFCGFAFVLTGLVFGAGMVTHKTKALVSYESLFYGEAVERAYSYAPSGVESYDKRQGLKLTSTQEGSACTLVDLASGAFEMEYRVFSDQQNQYDLESLRIMFTDANTKDSFSVEIGLTIDGLNGYSSSLTSAVRAVVDVGYGIGYAIDETSGKFSTYGKTLQSSYCNVSSDSIVVSFDPNTMCVYASTSKAEERYLLADLDNVEHLRQLGRKNSFTDFSEYRVDICFDRFSATAQSAGVMIYSLFGNELSERFLRETNGPSVYANTKRKARVNEIYDLLQNVKVYDLLAGDIAFDGEVNVFSPTGEQLSVTDGCFTPALTGFYSIEYTAKNAKGTFGKVCRVVLEVVDYAESVSSSCNRDVSDTVVGVNTALTLPAMIAQSNYLNDVQLPASVKISKENKVIYTQQRVWEEFEYSFTESGEYVVAYSVDFGGENPVEWTWKVTVEEDTPTFLGNKSASVYTVGDVLQVPVKTAVLNGEEYDTVAEVRFDDGSTNTSSFVLLDKEGKGKVQYTAHIHEKEYTYVESFEVCKTPASLWENMGGVTFIEDVDLPEYADEYGNGLLLQANRTGAKARYKNVLDLSATDLKTPIFEAMVTPENSRGTTYELAGLEILLTDANDSENFISVKLEPVAWGYHHRTSVKCKANFDYNHIGMNKSGEMGVTEIHVSMSGKYSGQYGTHPAWAFSLYFDATTKSIYAGPSGNTDRTLALVANLADPSQVGAGNEWGGFSTGEVVMEVKFLSLRAAKANLNVLRVCGQDMGGGTFKDKQAPSLVLDGLNESEIPFALVGAKYNIFQGRAFDLLDGALGAIKDIKVYCLQDGEKVYAEIKNGSFTPTKEQTYYVEYFAMDSSYNVVTKTVPIQALTTLPDIEYQLKNNLPDNLFVGDFLKIPAGQASGGAGNLQVSTCIKKGDEIYEGLENEIQLLNGGTYFYEVTVTDYIGQTKVFSYPVSVEYPDGAVVREKIVPKAIVINKEYEFPVFEAVAYTATATTDLPVTITVNGITLAEDRKYTPTQAGVLEVVYATTGWTKSFSVEVVDPSSSESYLDAFFLLDDDEVSIDVTEDSYAFVTDEKRAIDGNAKISFVNALGLQNARVELGVLENNFNSFNVYFTDKYDPTIQLKFTIFKGTATGMCNFSLNDGKTNEMVGSFNKGETRTPIAIVFNNNKIYDYNNNLLATAEKTLLGESFEGFPSGAVYVDFEIEGIYGESSIALYQLWNQLCMFVYGDYITPVVSVAPFEDRIDMGDVVTVPKIVAFDVLDPLNLVAELTVKCGNRTLVDFESGELLSGLVMQEGTNYSFKTEFSGKYSITVYVSDSEGNYFEYQKSFFVDGVIDPTITLQGSVPKECKVGQALTVPKAVGHDSEGNEIRVYAYFIDSSNRYHDVTAGTYKPTETGEFTIVYYCYDVSGNYARLTYNVTIK